MIEGLIILTQSDAFVEHLHALPGLSRKYICQIDEVFAHNDDLVTERAEEIAYSLARIVIGGVQPNRPEEMHHFWQIPSHTRGSRASLQLGASVIQNAQELDVRFRFDHAVLNFVLQHQKLADVSGLRSQ